MIKNNQIAKNFKLLNLFLLKLNYYMLLSKN